jgi:hypothetical protein
MDADNGFTSFDAVPYVMTHLKIFSSKSSMNYHWKWLQ